ncbi:unnamed protein product [Rangifer tarandus platyrhynchus]|uniref:Uncharacterized protein n=2 Tax=Rangifer tarandus platyrhynchus TaxID=3082113 RepID=A0AC59YE58_RANTA|nr:unnamed protein product [Rangifer tarandus platyrhynchus]
MHALPGRTLSQNDWPVKSWKLKPSPLNPRLGVTWQSSPPALRLGTPFPVISRASSACVPPRTIHFRVLDNSPLLGLLGVPLPATKLETNKLEKLERKYGLGENWATHTSKLYVIQRSLVPLKCVDVV